ncbi:hypothetical protein EDC32_103541 [Laceyella sacchari]|jgi:hypothetical protein|nr:hypothetical protein EDC32_103541 [Laceyella sacchari]
MKQKASLPKINLGGCLFIINVISYEYNNDKFLKKGVGDA